MTDSCFITKLSHYLTLSEHERKLLAGLEKEERIFGPRRQIYALGDRMTDLYLVKSGWLYSYVDLPDGGRQILRIHHPGDFLSFHDVAFVRTTSNLRTGTGAVLCPFPKASLCAILDESPRLTALLLALEMREQVLLADLLTALGCLRARGRVAHLLLGLRAKLRIANPAIVDRFRLGLTQGEIGDALGLSNVHVSNTLAAMVKDGLIGRQGDDIILRDEEGLKELCDFQDRYSEIDTSWFPRR